MKQYRGGQVPVGLPVKLRELLQKQDRFLRQLRSQPPVPSVPQTSQGAAVAKVATPSTNFVTLTSLAGLAVGELGTELIIRFQGTPTVRSTETVTLQSSFTPLGVDDLLHLVSDGVKWVEMGRGHLNELACPAVVRQRVSSCNPVAQVWGYDNADLWNLYYDPTAFGAGAKAVTQALNLIPVSDPETNRGLYYNGTESSPWKQVWGDGLHGRYVALEGGSVTLSSTVYTALSLSTLAGGLFQVYRLNPTVPVAVQGMLAPVYGVLFDLVNVGTNAVALYHLNGGAAAADQIITGETGQTHPIVPNDTARLWYDLTSAKWRLLK